MGMGRYWGKFQVNTTKITIWGKKVKIGDRNGKEQREIL